MTCSACKKPPTRKGWKAKLTKEELAHVRGTTVGGATLASFKRNRAQQKVWEAEGRGDVCLECSRIARKLGLE